MCLTWITEIEGEDGEGWKVIFPLDGGWTPIIKKGKIFPFGEWILDPNDGLIGCQDAAYKKGFHIFKKLEDADHYQEADELILKVRYRRVVCEGIQKTDMCHAHCVVAREIYVENPNAA
jgi:hypothetical protein